MRGNGQGVSVDYKIYIDCDIPNVATITLYYKVNIDEQSED